jgi:hypothetical protein
MRCAGRFYECACNFFPSLDTHTCVCVRVCARSCAVQKVSRSILLPFVIKEASS